MSRGWAAATTVVAAACLALAGQADALEVTLRVEGRTATVFEGPVVVDSGPVDGGDGSGSHDCGSGSASLIAALDSASRRAGFTWRGRWNADFQDFFVDRIGPDASDDATGAYWAALADWRYSGGSCATSVRAGAEILWAYDTVSRPLILRLTGPARAAVGETVTVAVRDGWLRADSGGDGGAVAGAIVRDQRTDAAGLAQITFTSPGLTRLKAERGDAIRSNALDVCVGDARCEGALPPPAAAPPAKPPAPAVRRHPTLRVALSSAVRFLRRARAERRLTRPLLRRIGRALRVARSALSAAEPPLEAGGRRLSARGVRLLRRRQNPDGGIARRARARSDSNSTARAVTRLIASGRYPRAFAAPGGATPVAYLLRCARPGGAIACGPSAAGKPVWSTAAATRALAAVLSARRESPAARRCGTAMRCR